MEKKLKLLSVFMVFMILLLLGVIVTAESYTSTLDVYSSLSGAGRYYSGSQILCRCDNTYLDTEYGTTSDTLTIACYKRGLFWIYHQIGSEVQETVFSSGYSTVDGSWNMDGAGTYRFQFIKGNWMGGQESIKSYLVSMYSN
ncbi:MAG: hypothetical protein ACYCYM_12500 [Saccharofermentanales bacterium]